MSLKTDWPSNMLTHFYWQLIKQVFNVTAPSPDSPLHLIIRSLHAHLFSIYFWSFSRHSHPQPLLQWHWDSDLILLGEQPAVCGGLIHIYKFIFPCCSFAGGMETDPTTIIVELRVRENGHNKRKHRTARCSMEDKREARKIEDGLGGLLLEHHCFQEWTKGK